MAAKLLKALLLGLSLARSADALRRAVRAIAARVVLLLLALLTLLTAIGFLIAAAYTAASAWIGPVYASLAIGGTLLLKAWFWIALSRRVGTTRQPRGKSA